MMRNVVVFAALVAVLAGSCSNGADRVTKTAPLPAVATVPVPTVPTSDVGEMAVFTAVLQWDPQGDCIYGVGGEEAGVPLVFPAGYAAVADRHAIVDDSGEVIAAEGDRVDLVGGSSDIVDGTIEAFGVTGIPCPDGPAWVVQFPIEPAGE